MLVELDSEIGNGMHLLSAEKISIYVSLLLNVHAFLFIQFSL